MNRRSLFKSLLGVAVAVSIDLGMSMPVLPSVSKVVKIIPNPAYQTAMYEDLIWAHEGVIKSFRCKIGDDDHVAFKNPDPTPPRYNYVNGEWVQIHKYIEQKS